VRGHLLKVVPGGKQLPGGGNDDDAVTMDHVTIAGDGRLSSFNHAIQWSIAIEVRYDAETEPGPR